jgi:hypothetical protein
MNKFTDKLKEHLQKTSALMCDLMKYKIIAQINPTPEAFGDIQTTETLITEELGLVLKEGMNTGIEIAVEAVKILLLSKII